MNYLIVRSDLCLLTFYLYKSVYRLLIKDLTSYINYYYCQHSHPECLEYFFMRNKHYRYTRKTRMYNWILNPHLINHCYTMVTYQHPQYRASQHCHSVKQVGIPMSYLFSDIYVFCTLISWTHLYLTVYRINP
jgi:hypothetical protein